ncbi:hypothetical protein HDV06_000688 [Boothiomyces sp. JEL0866]|nr:hypothetical protein HDV06_000688 [Boothiomyces sp. JEL0866]
MLPKIQTLYLENNSLAGQINPNISTLQSLRVLFLNNNLLAGYIPAQLGSLSNLQQLFGNQKVNITTTATPSPTASPQENSSSTIPLLGLYIALPVIIIFIGILGLLYVRRKRNEKGNLESGKQPTVRFSIDDPTESNETFYDSARPSTNRQEIVPPTFTKDVKDSESEISGDSSDDEVQLGQIYNKISRKAIDKTSTLGTNETGTETATANEQPTSIERVSPPFELPKIDSGDLGFQPQVLVVKNPDVKETEIEQGLEIVSEQKNIFSTSCDSSDFNLINRVKITEDVKSIETSIAECSEFPTLPRTITAVTQIKEDPEELTQNQVDIRGHDLKLKVTNYEKEHHIGGELDADSKAKTIERNSDKGDFAPEIPVYYFESFVSLVDTPLIASDNPIEKPLLLIWICAATPKYLFLGASQVYGWQLSYNNPHFPFGTDMQQILDNAIQSDIDGVPGDCFGGPHCGDNYPPNTSPQISSITGFSDRLKYQFSSVDYLYDWVIFLGGANDINYACFNNDYTHINNQTAAQFDLVNIVLGHNPKAKILFLPTYLGPLYEAKCQSLYQQFVNTLLSNSNTLSKKYPNQVYGIDSTPLILNRQPSYYVDDLHLNEQGNFALAQGLVDWFNSLVPTITTSTVILLLLLYNLVLPLL